MATAAVVLVATAVLVQLLAVQAPNRQAGGMRWCEKAPGRGVRGELTPPGLSPQNPAYVGRMACSMT